MKAATLLLIQADEDNDGVYLYRFAGTEFAGDTWHEDPDVAKEQAQDEFAVGTDNWKEVPDTIVDPVQRPEELRALLG